MLLRRPVKVFDAQSVDEGGGNRGMGGKGRRIQFPRRSRRRPPGGWQSFGSKQYTLGALRQLQFRMLSPSTSFERS